MKVRPGRILGGLLVVGILLSAAALAVAKGPPSLVSITGPGLAEPVEIDDPTVLEAFSFFIFEDVTTAQAAPDNPGEGYVVTRYITANNGISLKPWDRVIYYPASGEVDSSAYLEGLIGEDMSTEFDGAWYPVSTEGEAAMQAIIRAHQTPSTRQAAEPARFGHGGFCGR
jgi:hypothetical protein